MLLTELFDRIDHELIGADVNISKIEYDSRKVCPGDLFCCIVGTAQDGHRFAQSAFEKGAVALLVEHKLDIDVPQVLVKNSRRAMAEVSCAFYDNPSSKMKMVGVTGTNGKTTTTYMLKAIAQQQGIKVGLIGTIKNMIGEETIETERTTPESVDLQRLLSLMVEKGVEICFMEVSSHSLDQYRVHGITFDVGIFTNLTQDHLDYHKTFDNYRDAKRKLFQQSKFAIVNIDDPAGAYMVENLDTPTYTVGVREISEVTAKNIDITTRGVTFDMLIPNGESLHIKLNIPGLFSVFNSMSAGAAALALGYSPQNIKNGLESLSSVAGRLEKLDVKGHNFTVLLDYAHTPDALENIMKTVHEFSKKRVVTLFGCGGDRDRAKRPIMGEIAGRYSDFCIITSDNPRSENPMSIIKMVEEGMKKSGCDYAIIENRREAIRYALNSAQDEDVIILAGKGHETYQEIKGVKAHFDEKEIVSELIDEMDAH